MDYLNAQKKKDDYVNAVKQDKKQKTSGFKAFTRFLNRWASIHPPVLKELR